MENHLQLIIGVDKNNPNFTIYRDSQAKEIHVYIGLALLEIIPDKKDDPNLKFLLARLFNANVNRRRLTETFGYSYHTMQRWGEAIKSGDAERMVRALGGQGAPRKLTKEIEGYIAHRFKSIYAVNKRSYSQEIRDEIKKVFQVEIAPETLRVLFGTLKEQYYQEKAKQEKKTL